MCSSSRHGALVDAIHNMAAGHVCIPMPSRARTACLAIGIAIQPPHARAVARTSGSLVHPSVVHTSRHGAHRPTFPVSCGCRGRLRQAVDGTTARAAGKMPSESCSPRAVARGRDTSGPLLVAVRRPVPGTTDTGCSSPALLAVLSWLDTVVALVATTTAIQGALRQGHSYSAPHSRTEAQIRRAFHCLQGRVAGMRGRAMARGATTGAVSGAGLQ